MNVMIENDNIIEIDLYGSRNCIGVVSKKYMDMKKSAELATNKAEEFFNLKEKYFEKLVKHGLETKAKTQEEINTEILEKITKQEEVNNKLIALIEDLRKESVTDEPKQRSRQSKSVRNIENKD